MSTLRHRGFGAAWQSCAACHGPAVGFTGPAPAINAGTVVYPGAVHTRFGNREPPTSAYAGDSPVLHFDDDRGLWSGGMFWDGRATGWMLRDSLAEQAMGPFLNPLEQNNPQMRLVVLRVAQSDDAPLFEQAGGIGSLDYRKDVGGTYERIARSIAAYKASVEVKPFSSKYDSYLTGDASLSPQESVRSRAFRRQGDVRRVPHEPPRAERRAAVVHRFHLRQHRHAEEPAEAVLRRDAELQPQRRGLARARLSPET